MRDHRIEGVGEVDAEDLLALLDAGNVHEVGRDEVGFSCLWTSGHAYGDRNPSAHINRETLLWRCKGCGRSGNLLELTKLGLPTGTSYPDAMAWLRKHFGEVVRAPRGGSLAADLDTRLQRARSVHDKQLRTLPNEAETIGPDGIFAVDWRGNDEAAVYMRGRGFSPEVLEDWGLGWDGWTRRVTIPVRDETGTLVGFKGRAIDAGVNAKYLLLGDKEDRAPRYGIGYGFDMHDARKVVFGLDRARGCKRVAMPEGELDVIACYAAGIPAVCPGTTSITSEQLWLLRAHFDELVNFYDSGKAGEDAVWGTADENGKWHPGLVEKITPYFALYVVDDHEGDPASMTEQQVRDLYEGAKHWVRYSLPPAASV